jgi:hypothetical protein
MARKAKSKKRGCSSTTGTKLYLVENNGKLTVSKCKSKAKKVLSKCRKRIKRAGRGVCQMNMVKAHKQKTYKAKRGRNVFRRSHRR